MDSCSYPTLVAKTQSSTSKKIEFIDEDKRLTIFPPKHYFTPMLSVDKFWPSFDPFPFLFLMFLMDGILGFRAATIDVLQARPPQLVLATVVATWPASVTTATIFYSSKSRKDRSLAGLTCFGNPVMNVSWKRWWLEIRMLRNNSTPLCKGFYTNHHPFMEKKTMSFRKIFVPNTSLIYNLP